MREEYPKHWYEYECYDYHVLIRGFRWNYWVITLSLNHYQIKALMFHCPSKRLAKKIGEKLLTKAIQYGWKPEF